MLTVISDGKGEIILDNNCTMMEQGIAQVRAMAYGLLEQEIYGEFFIVVPCDNLILPTRYTGKVYRQDKGLYLYARRTQVLGASLDELKRWGPPFGQMFRRKEDNIVKGFVEKPSIWKLLNATMADVIEESRQENVEAFLGTLADYLDLHTDGLNRKYRNNPIGLLVVPMVTREEVWRHVYENNEVESDLRTSINLDAWMNLWQEAQALRKDNSAIDKLVSAVLTEGGRDCFSNTFYFLLSRAVAEKLYTLYSQPTENNNGSFWARNVPLGQTPRMVRAIDWATLILTPMTITEDAWMHDYEKRGIACLANEKKVLPAGINTQTERAEILAAAERDTTYTYNDWRKIWHMAQEISKVAGGLTCVNFGPVWADAGSVEECKRTGDIEVSETDLLERALYRGMLNLPIRQNLLYCADTGEGKIEYPNNYLRYRSLVEVPKGVTLRIGNRVRITNSIIRVIAEPGEVVCIPDDTAIVASNITARLKGDKKGSYIYRYELTEKGAVLEFTGNLIGTVHTTLGKFTTEHPIALSPAALGDQVVAGKFTFRELIAPKPGEKKVNREASYGSYHSIQDGLTYELDKVERGLRAVPLRGRLVSDICKAIQVDRALNKGTGHLSTILLKGGEEGGLQPQFKAQILDRLSEDFVVLANPVNCVGKTGVLVRWGMIGLQHPLEIMQRNPRYTPEFLEEARRYIRDKDAVRIEDWIKKAAAIDPDELGPKALACALNYLSHEAQQIFLYRKNSRREVMKKYIRGEHNEELDMERIEQIASDLLHGKTAYYETDEQDFVKTIVVGATNPFSAHPGSLRNQFCNQIFEIDALARVIDKARDEFGILDMEVAATIMNAIHSPRCEEMPSEIEQIATADLEM